MEDEKRWFQWVAGEKRTQIQIFDKIESDEDGTFIVFKDGSRRNENLVAEINTQDLTGKVMAEIGSPDNGWSFKDEYVGKEEEVWETNADGDRVCVIPYNPGRKVVKIIPPKYAPKRQSNFGQVTDYKPAIDKNDPVYILMSKSKKTDTEITMGITISLPPKTLYNLAKESFDEGDGKFIKYIVEEITTSEIKEALSSAIKNMYEDTQNISE